MCRAVITARCLLVLSCLCAALFGGLACTGENERTRQTTAASEALGGEGARAEAFTGDAKTRRHPSFRLFSAWLAAFNSGDRERYLAFLEKKFPSRTTVIEPEMGFREVTGGFDLRKVTSASETEIKGWVQERDSDQFAEFVLWLQLDIDSAVAVVSGNLKAAKGIKNHVIADLQLRDIPRPTEFPVERLSEDEALASAEALANKRAVAGMFSGAVLVAKDGEILFAKAYGLADRERGIANTLQTRFRVGSMNKMFTAVAILQLEQAGKIDLSAPLARYLPDYPNKDVARRVTIHRLLTHTGGTGDIFGHDFDTHRNELRTLADYVELYGERGLGSDAGSWAYSNYGFILLGAVIEKVTRQSYYDYVRANIFKPAGMTRSGFLPERLAVPDRSVGYMKPPGATEWVPNTGTLPYRGTSAGGGYSTVEDLARFAEALMRHELLSPDSTELLVAGKIESWPSAKYAYGFEDSRDAEGNGPVGHGGGAPGMNGDLRIYPKSGYVVAVLANMDPPAAQRISDYLGPRLPTDG